MDIEQLKSHLRYSVGAPIISLTVEEEEMMEHALLQTSIKYYTMYPHVVHHTVRYGGLIPLGTSNHNVTLGIADLDGVVEGKESSAYITGVVGLTELSRTATYQSSIDPILVQDSLLRTHRNPIGSLQHKRALNAISTALRGNTSYWLENNGDLTVSIPTGSHGASFDIGVGYEKDFTSVPRYMVDYINHVARHEFLSTIVTARTLIESDSTIRMNNEPLERMMSESEEKINTFEERNPFFSYVSN